MKMQDSNYHAGLRVSAVVFACVLLFQSGLLLPATSQLAEQTGRYVAATVGVKATVQSTELNEYTAELTQLERDLEAREAAIAAREIEIGLNNSESATRTDTSTFILSAILFILVVLIVLNYVLDYMRSRPVSERHASHELVT